MQSLLSLLVFSLVVLGCDTSGLGDQERADLQSGDAQIKLGETVQLDGLTIRFDSVVEDSRCPMDVQCVWQGEARVALTIDGEAFTLLISNFEYSPEGGARVGDMIVYVDVLAPYPRHHTPSNATPVIAVSAVPAEG